MNRLAPHIVDVARVEAAHAGDQRVGPRVLQPGAELARRPVALVVAAREFLEVRWEPLSLTLVAPAHNPLGGLFSVAFLGGHGRL